MFSRRFRDDAELRLLEERHAEFLFRAVTQNRQHLEPWFPWVAGYDRVEAPRQFIRQNLQQLADNAGFNAGIFVGDDLAGVAGFHRINWLNRDVEMGYWISEKFQGRGLVTDAVRCLITHAFREWRLNRIQIRCATSNTRSAAVARRLGFVQEGIQRQALLLRGVFHDALIFGLLAQDWMLIPPSASSPSP
jgi:ribosomal-protein-serine acetyltransferase